MVEAPGSVPATPQRIGLNASPKTIPASSVAVPCGTAPKRNSTKVLSTASVPVINKLDVIPVIVPRTNMRSEQAAESRREVSVAGRAMPFTFQSKASDFRKFPNIRDEVDKPIVSGVPEFTGSKAVELGNGADRNIFHAVKSLNQGLSAAEKSMKDDRFVGSGKQEVNSMTETVASYQHENCVYLNLYNSTCLIFMSFLAACLLRIINFVSFLSKCFLCDKT